MKIHVVKDGETPRDITQNYTGSSNRVHELVSANPDWPRVLASTGTLGKPIVAFDPAFWRDEVQVNLPESWTGDGGDGGGAVGAPYGRQALRSTKFSPVRPVRQVRSEWDMKHPQWQGSNIAYWSQRIEAFIKSLSQPGGVLSQLILTNNWPALIPEFLRTYGSVRAFELDMQAMGSDDPRDTTGGSGPTFTVFDVPGYWYAKARDSHTAGTAGLLAFPKWWADTDITGLLGSPNGMVGADPYDTDEDEDLAMAGSGTCSNGVISDVKEYQYEIQEDDGAGLASIAERWGLPARKWLDLSKANHNIPHTYYGSGSTKHCEPDRSKLWAGRMLKIPKSWPDPPEALWPRLKNSDGTPYTPGGTGGPGGGGEGTEGIDPSKWYGDSGSVGWVWPVLIVGAAALSGVLLVGASKKKGGSR